MLRRPRALIDALHRAENWDEGFDYAVLSWGRPNRNNAVAEVWFRQESMTPPRVKKFPTWGWPSGALAQLSGGERSRRQRPRT